MKKDILALKALGVPDSVPLWVKALIARTVDFPHEYSKYFLSLTPNLRIMKKH